MKRTLLVTIDFPPMFGGVANYWANLSRYLESDNFVVLASEYDNSLDFDIKQNYLIYRKKLLSTQTWIWPKWLPLLYHTFQLVRQEKIEKIIVGHVLPIGTVAYLLNIFLKIPYLVSVHGLDVAISRQHPRKAKLVKKIFHRAEAIIVNSQATQELVLKVDNQLAAKNNIIYPCPNIQKREIPQEFREQLIKKYNLADKRLLLTVGRLIERKGQDRMLEALPQILQKYPNSIYFIVGKGNYANKLKNLIQELELEKNVFLFEDILDDELPAFYDLAEFFVMPARILKNGDLEGFGIVYLEANLYGKAVIAGNVGGAKEAVENQITGILVDPNNPLEIAAAVLDLLDNPEKTKLLGQQGGQRVKQKFNWSEQAQKLIKLLIK